MAEKIIDRLVSVKSIVTVALTAVFGYLAVVGSISGQEFMTIFTVVISFYFGVQSEKKAQGESADAAIGVPLQEIEDYTQPHGITSTSDANFSESTKKNGGTSK